MLICNAIQNLSKLKLNILFLLTILFTDNIISQEKGEIYFAGEMRKVMRQGDFSNHISLDTIPFTTNTYGLGPLEGLQGELLVIGGKSYRSTLQNDTIYMEETQESKAPFFAYTDAETWRDYPLPDTVRNLQELENYLLQIFPDENKPFTIMIKGEIERATFHIVNLPTGVYVRSHDELIKYKRYFELQNEEVEIIGFFSKAHRGIFMHHDSFLHLHIITNDRKQMGHLDEITFIKDFTKLYISY